MFLHLQNEIPFFLIKKNNEWKWSIRYGGARDNVADFVGVRKEKKNEVLYSSFDAVGPILLFFNELSFSVF